MVDTTTTKSSISKPLDDDSRAGAPEIEITPAMIGAGMKILASYYPDSADGGRTDKEMVARIIRVGARAG